jgi:nicotinamidase-related amidase
MTGSVRPRPGACLSDAAPGAQDRGMGSALLVIDVQESFRHTPGWGAASNPDVEADVNRLVRIARRRGDQVIWVLHAEPGSGTPFDPASGYVRPMIGLTAPDPGEPVLTKTAHNAFTTTDLQRLLTRAGIGHLVICGIRTEQCCETTARLAFDLGYAVTFVTEATATTPLPHRDAPAGRDLAAVLADPATLSTEEIVRRTEYALAGRFARIATIEDLDAADPAPAPAVS